MVAFSLLSVAVLAAGASAQFSGKPIKDDRASHVFLPLTAAQKETTATQVERLLSTWVNFESKQTYYPAGSPVDPFPKLAAVRAKLANVTEAELHLTYANAFANFRDGHTNYVNSGPYRCFTAATGVVFTFAEVDGKRTPIVSRFTSRKPVLDINKDGLSKISVGDELVSFNGQSFEDYYRDNQWLTGGAGEAGGRRSALYSMTGISGAYNELPSRDENTFVLKSATTGQQYTVTMPFVSLRNDDCWAKTSALMPSGPKFAPAQVESGRAVETGATVSASAKPKIDYLKTPMAVHSNPLKALLEHPKGGKIGPVTTTETDISGLSWGIYDPQGKNLGIIRMDDFEPRDPSGALNDQLALTIMHGLLSNELKDTNAILFDMRGNGGGLISYADGIPQLFQADHDPMGARYLYKEIMKRLFVDPYSPSDSFRQAYEKTKPGSKYTELGYFGTMAEANQIGHAYVRPIGLLTDGDCFSACELLSANIQNTDIGIIFGEDSATGGGGANVLEHKNLVAVSNFLKNDDFVPLPYTDVLGDLASSMRVGIRQTVRTGKALGKLIEDSGVPTDIIVLPTREDIAAKGPKNTQFDRIADELARRGAKTGQNALHFASSPIAFDALGPFNFAPEIAGLNEILIQTPAGKRIARRVDMFSDVGGKRVFPVKVASTGSGLGNAQLTVLGKANGKQVVKAQRYVRTLAKDADRIDATKPYTWDLKTGPAVGVYNAGIAVGNPALGWNKVGDKWVIGDGTSYLDNVDTDIVTFFTAPVGTTLSVTLKATVNSEPDYDYLYLNYIAADGASGIPLIKSINGETGQQVPGISGKATIDQTFSVTTTSEKFTLSLRFVSDGGVNVVGATISAFSVAVGPNRT